jgi:hypothetical protein
MDLQTFIETNKVLEVESTDLVGIVLCEQRLEALFVGLESLAEGRYPACEDHPLVADCTG